MRFYMLTYPWDLFDEGLDAALDRLHGEIGITGLSVIATSGPVSYLRSRAVEPRVIQSLGGFLFTPDERFYESTRVKPVVSSRVKPKNSFAHIAEACAKRGMELRLEVSATQVWKLVSRYPFAACKCAFGAASEYTLCHCNPDVRAALVGLCRDLASSYHPAGIIIHDFDAVWREWFMSEAGPGYDRCVRDLLSLCFCESCRQMAAGAGIDSEVASRFVRDVIDRWLVDGESLDAKTDAREIVKESADLSAMISQQEEAAISLVSACRDVAGNAMIRGDAHTTGEPARLAEMFSGRVIRQYELANLSESQHFVCDRVVSANEVYTTPGPDIVTAITQAARAGWRSTVFSHYGLLSDSALSKLRQAIRFARRSS